MILADLAPPIIASTAEQEIWNNFPAEDRPDAQEMKAAELVARGISVSDPAERLQLLHQARGLLLRPTRFRGLVLYSLANEFAVQKREREAAAAVAECLQLRPGDAKALALSAALKMEASDPSEGVVQLIAAIQRDPAIADHIPPELVDMVFRKLSYVGKAELGSELLQVLANGNWGRDDPARASNLALRLANELVTQGKKAEAIALLPRIIDPRVGLALIVDRRFDPIRADIEAWSKGNLELQRDAFAAAAEGAFSVDPDVDRRLKYANALQAAGKQEEAIALLLPVVQETSLWAGDERQSFYAGLAAVRLADMLHTAGRGDQAISILTAFEPKLRAAYPQGAVNIVPNLARLMVWKGHSDAALKLLDERTPHVDEVEAAGALGHFEAIRLCARKQKGEAVSDAVSAFRTAYAGNDPVMQTLASCLGDKELLKTFLIGKLRKPDQRDEALILLQAARFGVNAPGYATFNGLIESVFSDPDLAAAEKEYGRPAPVSYKPAFAGWADK